MQTNAAVKGKQMQLMQPIQVAMLLRKPQIFIFDRSCHCSHNLELS